MWDKPFKATDSCELHLWRVARFARGVEPSCWANGTAAFGSWDGADVLCCAWHVHCEHAWQFDYVPLNPLRLRSYSLHLRPIDPLIITESPLLRHFLIAAWLSSLCKLWKEEGMTKQGKGINLLRGMYLQCAMLQEEEEHTTWCPCGPCVYDSVCGNFHVDKDL